MEAYHLNIEMFVSSFMAVFLLSTQQQNVVFGHFKLAAVTSMAIAGAQYVMITSVAAGGSWLLMGIGGAAGVTSSMFIHRKYVRRK